MGRRDDDDEYAPSFLARMLGASESGLSWILICAFLVFLFFATYFLWGRFGDILLSGNDFKITAESLEVTPQPEWIQRSNVAAEATVSGSLIGLSSREPDLTVRVGQAFLMHPWVRKVNHCRKRYPAKVSVNLEYRQPVGMVEVRGGRLPIDSEGVLLPTIDFSPDVANAFPRIVASQTNPVSDIAGSQWGDERVHGAARLAGFLLPYWRQLGLQKVIAYRGPRNALAEAPPYFVLRTVQGTNIIWGHAPEEKRSGEPPAEQKLVRLSEFAKRSGSLDVIEQDQSIDLRKAGSLNVAALPDDLN